MRVDSLKHTGPGGHLSPRAGRGRIALAIRVRGALRKRGRDRFKNARHVSRYIIVPETKHPVIVIGIPRVVSVLASVDLNYETVLAANQINRVWTDGFLSNELVTVQATRPKPMPKSGFRISGFAPQTPGTRGLFLIGRAHAETPPHPDCFAIRPLPAGGERLSSRVSK